MYLTDDLEFKITHYVLLLLIIFIMNVLIVFNFFTFFFIHVFLNIRLKMTL